MNIRVRAKEILQPLQQVAKVVNTRNAMPILNNVLVDVKSDAAYLTTSDGETWLSIKCPILQADTDGKFCINANDLLRALGNLGDIEVTINVDNDKHTATFNYGNGKFTLPYEDADAFPVTAKQEENETTTRIIDGKRIFKAIEKTGFATANEELRPIMNGIHFDFFADGMVCATTNGHKLARYKDTTITHDDKDNTPNFTLPKKPSNILMSLLGSLEGDVRLSFSPRLAVVSNSNFKLTTRLIDSKYPNYNAVIPQQCATSVTICNADMQQALRRVMPMGNAASELVILNFKNNGNAGQLTISAEDFDFSKSASETITCDYDGTQELTIGFKGSTLFDILRNIDDDNIIMELNDKNRPGVVHAGAKDEYLSLLMPMLID